MLLPPCLPSSITKRHAVRQVLFALLVLVFTGNVTATFAGETKNHTGTQNNDGIFLVATKKLNGTSFQKAVILLTHYSNRGATGLTVNRPAGIKLRQAFPGVRQLQQRSDPLFLGGPVSTNAIFVLLRTQQPHKKMHHIADDIYFSTAKHAFDRSPKYSANTATRTYAGYAGWATGQLQNEIDRGDWLMVHTRPGIIFEKDTESLWQRLTKRWTGKWI